MPRPKDIVDLDRVDTLAALLSAIEDPVVTQKILDHLKGKAETKEPKPLPER